MNMRNRLIALGVFLVLAVALFILVAKADLRSLFSGAEEERPSALEDELFPEAVLETVTAIEVTDHESGQTFAASLDETGAWQIDALPEGADASLPPDSDRLLGTLVGLPGLRPTRILSGVEALAPYGLDQARYTVRFRVTGGGEYTLYVGSTNPIDTAYYVRLTDNPTVAGEVYLISKYSLEGVVGLVADPPLLAPTPTPTPEADTEG